MFIFERLERSQREALRTGAIQICEFLGAFVIRAPSRHGPVLLRGRYHRVGIGIVLEHRVLVDLALGLHRRQKIRRHGACGRRGLPQVRHFYVLHILSRKVRSQ